jgi:hypothetical protein
LDSRYIFSSVQTCFGKDKTEKNKNPIHKNRLSAENTLRLDSHTIISCCPLFTENFQPTDGNNNFSFAPLTQLTDQIILHTCTARLGQSVSVSGMEEPSFGIIIMLACFDATVHRSRNIREKQKNSFREQKRNL